MNNSDYISIASATIALLAFVVTIWQGWITRAHNILSVTPLLHINIDDTDGLKYSIENHGLGPGIIKDFIIRVGNNVYENPVRDPYPEIIQSINLCSMQYEYFLPTEGSALLPEHPKILLSLKFTDPNSNVYSYAQVEEKIEFEIQYQSIYKNKTFKCSSRWAG
ncbi:MAG: hypothetical protein WC762_10690 [Methylobacter sp.]|jgi:hypothetical protein